MPEMRPYVVRQGDYLARIAASLGFDAQAVWGDEANASLRQRRPNPEMLAPGDILHVPAREPAGAPFSPGGTRRYKARVPKVTVRIQLSSGGEAISGEDYVVEGAGRHPITGTTDGSGTVSFEVPVTVRECLLRLPGRRTVYPILVGHMDPVEEETGLRSRLEHMGFLAPELRDVLSGGMLGRTADRDTVPERPDDALPQAIRDFQRAHGLPETGDADPGTLAAVRRAHDGEA